MGSALLEETVTNDAAKAAEPDTLRGAACTMLPDASALRRQAAERVAAHRSRRIGANSAAGARVSSAPRNTRSAKIAAAVAERYAQAQSYGDFLAAEAERAVQQARVAADAAAANARALEIAEQRLLAALLQEEEAPGDLHTGQVTEPVSLPQEMERESSPAPMLWAELDHDVQEQPAKRRGFQPPQSRPKQVRRGHAAERVVDREAATAGVGGHTEQAPTLADGITIRLYQDESGATRVTLDPPTASSIPVRAAAYDLAESEEEARLLDEEIDFRQEPVFEEPGGPAEPLPANLIEFPRQLVATRKARPRLAEGPLREEMDAAPGAGQLRIFEVEREQIAVAPAAEAETGPEHIAQWSSILLESRPRAETAPSAGATSEAQAADVSTPQAAPRSLANVASLRRRVLAATVNAAILGAACVVFAAVFLSVAGHLAGSTGGFRSRAAIGPVLPFAACAFVLLAAIYQALFFTLSTATPGMRVARIALCTFTDQNPKRTAVRRRLPIVLLSMLPMGLGFLWAMLDEERLAWHDRICGIYQRSY
jgi:uncharacterized RDD family membrane protein YckC